MQKTSFNEAVKKGNIEIVELLLKQQNLDINIPNKVFRIYISMKFLLFEFLNTVQNLNFNTIKLSH